MYYFLQRIHQFILLQTKIFFLHSLAWAFTLTWNTSTSTKKNTICLLSSWKTQNLPILGLNSAAVLHGIMKYRFLLYFFNWTSPILANTSTIHAHLSTFLKMNAVPGWPGPQLNRIRKETKSGCYNLKSILPESQKFFLYVVLNNTKHFLSSSIS